MVITPIDEVLRDKSLNNIFYIHRLGQGKDQELDNRDIESDSLEFLFHQSFVGPHL